MSGNYTIFGFCYNSLKSLNLVTVIWENSYDKVQKKKTMLLLLPEEGKRPPSWLILPGGGEAALGLGVLCLSVISKSELITGCDQINT